jgi:Icc-related predicted phosphoesterase
VVRGRDQSLPLTKYKEKKLSGFHLFFATDIHGSETCFRKFLNAGLAYKAEVLIMGGDMTGKMLIPLVAQAGGRFSFEWLGSAHTLPESELPEYEKQMRLSGCYPYRTTPEEKAALEQDPVKLKRLFAEVMRATVVQWLDLADQRLAGTGIECFITPGNDDVLEVDEAFKASPSVRNPEGAVTVIKGEYEMIACGYSNRTPWNSPREMEEEALEGYLQGMAKRLTDPSKAIFNFHCPPYDSGLDTAPKIDKTLKPVTGITGVEMTAVGSAAVAHVIREYQPLLGLHGHVHESRAAIKLGRTLCVNPGSEYSEGILRGCLLWLDKGKVRDYMLTSG